MAPRRKQSAEPALSAVDLALSAMSAAAKKQKSGFTFTTIAESADDWRWIDFIDPKTGLPALILEYLWGSRGMLAGRLLKIEAEESVGKSSYCMLQYAMAQRTAKAWCVHLEGEEATAPPDFIASFGCNPKDVIVPQFDKRAIDECFNRLDWVTHCIRDAGKKTAGGEDDKHQTIDPACKHPIVAGVDSISSFGTASNMDDEGDPLNTGQGGLGLHSRFLSQWFRDKWTMQTRRQLFLMTVTQLRETIEASSGFPGGPRPQGKKGMTTIAARPLNYHATYRLEMRSKPFRRKLNADQVGPVIGDLVTLITTKNKLSPKGKQIELPLIWDAGFEMTEATVDLLIALSPIKFWDGSVFEVSKAGGWLKCPALYEKAVQFSIATYPEICLDFLNRLYSNTNLLMCIREAMRIRGFGFKFEQYYTPSSVEIEDLQDAEPAADSAPEKTGVDDGVA